MADELFAPELAVVVYAAVAASLFVWVYRARLARLAWWRPPTNPVAEKLVSAPDPVEYPEAAFVARTFILGVGVLSALVAAVVVPALAGAMTRASTLNVLLVLLSSVLIALAMGRLALTLFVLGIKFALLGGLLLVLAAGAVYLYAFVNNDGLRVRAQIDDASGRLAKRLDEFDRTTGNQIATRIMFNGCVMWTALKTVGDMATTWARCDPQWLYQRQLRARAARAEYDAWADQHSFGVPRARVEQRSTAVAGTWLGGVECGGKRYGVELRLTGDPRVARGVMHVMRMPPEGLGAAAIATASTYRVEATKNDSEVGVRVLETLRQGEGTPPMDGAFEHRLNQAPQLVAKRLGTGCEGRLSALTNTQ